MNVTMLGNDDLRQAFLLGGAREDVKLLKPLAFRKLPGGRKVVAGQLEKMYKAGKLSLDQYRTAVRITAAEAADYEKATGKKYPAKAASVAEGARWLQDAYKNKVISAKEARWVTSNTGVTKADYQRITGKKWPEDKEWYQKAASGVASVAKGVTKIPVVGTALKAGTSIALDVVPGSRSALNLAKGLTKDASKVASLLPGSSKPKAKAAPKRDTSKQKKLPAKVVAKPTPSKGVSPLIPAAAAAALFLL